MKKNYSEFGKGCTYCLGLFLAHEALHTELFEKKNNQPISKLAYELWFNAASDHLYDLQIPAKFPVSLQRRLKIFRKKCLYFGHGFPKEHATEKDYKWAINEGKALLLLIDKRLGVQVKRGEWQ